MAHQGHSTSLLALVAFVVQLFLIHSAGQLQLRIHNNLGHKVQLFWLNDMNKEVLATGDKGYIFPHSEVSISTWGGHRFVARALDEDEKPGRIVWSIEATANGAASISEDPENDGFIAEKDLAKDGGGECHPDTVLKGHDITFEHQDMDKPHPSGPLFRDIMKIPAHLRTREPLFNAIEVTDAASREMLLQAVEGADTTEGEDAFIDVGASADRPRDGIVKVSTVIAFYRPGECERKMRETKFAGRFMGPMFCTAAEVDMDADAALGERFDVDTCPTILLWKGGVRFAKDTAETFQGWDAPNSFAALTQFVWTSYNLNIEFVNEYNKAVTFNRMNDEDVFNIELEPMITLEPGERGSGTIRVPTMVSVTDAKTGKVLRAPWRPAGDTTLTVREAERDIAVHAGDLGHGECTGETEVCIIRNEVLSEAGAMVNHFYRRHLNRISPLTVPRFTPEGFRITDVPKPVFAKLAEWFKRAQRFERLELIQGYYVNHKAADVFHVDMPDHIRNCLFDGMKPLFESWAGTKLEGTACYGVRTYTNGSTLAPHTDTVETHAVSAIVNIEQKGMRKPWYLRILDHDGVPRDVSVKPGKMILYESARLAHGRPEPLQGDRFSSMFIHYKPVRGWARGAPKRLAPEGRTDEL